MTDLGKLRRRRLIADNILAARQARGISQEALAGQVGVSRRQVIRWEHAVAEPREHLDDLLAVLGLTMADLYAGPASRVNPPLVEPLP